MKPRTGAERKQPQDIFLVEEGEKTRDRIDTRYILGVSRKLGIEQIQDIYWVYLENQRQNRYKLYAGCIQKTRDRIDTRYILGVSRKPGIEQI